MTTKKTVETASSEMTSALLGALDAHAKLIEQAFSVSLRNKAGDTEGGSIEISGEEACVDAAGTVIEYLRRLFLLRGSVTEQNVRYAVSMVTDGAKEELFGFDEHGICVTNRGKVIQAKTAGQRQYVDAIRDNTVVIGVGPAGTGKTFLAVAMAVNALRGKQVSRIVLTRPAVEAGERLGYLPGDLQSKIDPYLRPLYDALYEMLGGEAYNRYLEKGTIEIAPLAYMRGRTLDDSFIILDEAQNTTPEQMKMFLTRLGFRSKAVVTGDLTQTDLPAGKTGGLAQAVEVLKNINGIAVHRFTKKDVVRHHLVQKIIEAYEKAQANTDAIPKEPSLADGEGKGEDLHENP